MSVESLKCPTGRHFLCVQTASAARKLAKQCWRTKLEAFSSQTTMISSADTPQDIRVSKSLRGKRKLRIAKSANVRLKRPVNFLKVFFFIKIQVLVHCHRCPRSGWRPQRNYVGFPNMEFFFFKVFRNFSI